MNRSSPDQATLPKPRLLWLTAGLVAVGATGWLALPPTERRAEVARTGASSPGRRSVAPAVLVAPTPGVSFDPPAVVIPRVPAAQEHQGPPSIDATTVAAARAIAVADTDPVTRDRAVVDLQQMVLEEPGLAPLVRAALLDAAQAAVGDARAASRAAALECIPLDDATDADLARLTRFLADPCGQVRAASAWSLRAAPVPGREAVVTELTRALEQETDADVRVTLARSLARLGGRDLDLPR